MAWITYQRLPIEHREDILQIMDDNYLLDDLIIRMIKMKVKESFCCGHTVVQPKFVTENNS